MRDPYKFYILGLTIAYGPIFLQGFIRQAQEIIRKTTKGLERRLGSSEMLSEVNLILVVASDRGREMINEADSSSVSVLNGFNRA